LQINGLLDDDGNQKEPSIGIPIDVTFGIGLNLSLTQNMTLDISLLSFPGLIGGSTLSYTF